MSSCNKKLIKVVNFVKTNKNKNKYFLNDKKYNNYLEKILWKISFCSNKGPKTYLPNDIIKIIHSYLYQENEFEKFYIPNNLINYKTKFINPFIFNNESRALIRSPNVKVVRFVNKSPNFKLYVKEDNISFFHKIIEIEKNINNKMIDKYIELINILGEKYQIVNVLNRMILDYLNNYTSPFKNNTLLIKYDNNIKILQCRSRSRNSMTYDFAYNKDIIKKK